MNESLRQSNVAGSLLARLAVHGVSRIWGNWGTDSAPLIEAAARGAQTGEALPRLVTAPHEMAAISAAHGEALVTGRAGATFVHVTVGTANAAAGVINAARQAVPLLVLAGRTPITERGLLGSRSRHVHWAQESFDQAAMVREYLKWDYELRVPEQVCDALDRALAIAHSPPAGPVYLALPREVLAEACGVDAHGPGRFAIAGAAPASTAVMAAVDALLAAERPVIATGRSGRDPEAVLLLARLATALGAGVVEPGLMQHVGLPASHPLHRGFGEAGAISEADVALVLDSDVPWGGEVTPPPLVIGAGPDPSFSAYAMRTHPFDVALTGEVRAVLEALVAEVERRPGDPRRRAAVKRRTAELAAAGAERRAQESAAVAEAPSGASSMEWVSHCVGRFVGEDTVVLNEYDAVPAYLRLDRPGSFLGSPPSGGLGWGLGAAIGVAVARPESEVVAVLGDGTFVFANPVACLAMAAEVNAAIIVVICDNGGWAEVGAAVDEMYPAGAATGSGRGGPAGFTAPPAYHKVAAACGAAGLSVTEAAGLPAALEEARAARRAGRSAVVNVRCCW